MDKNQKELIKTYFRKRSLNQEGFPFYDKEVRYMIDHNIEINTLSNATIHLMLTNNPQYFEKLLPKIDVGKLGYPEIRSILNWNPDMAAVISGKAKFKNGQINYALLHENPNLIDDINIFTLERVQMTNLLTWHRDTEDFTKRFFEQYSQYPWSTDTIMKAVIELPFAGEYLNLDKLNKDEIYWVLKYKPELAPKVNTKQLTSDQIYGILHTQGEEAAKYLDLNKLKGHQIFNLIKHDMADYQFDLSFLLSKKYPYTPYLHKLSDSELSSILRNQPNVINVINIGKLKASTINWLWEFFKDYPHIGAAIKNYVIHVD